MKKKQKFFSSLLTSIKKKTKMYIYIYSYLFKRKAFITTSKSKTIKKNSVTIF